MTTATLLLTLILGIIAGAASVWPFRRRAPRRASGSLEWPQDLTLGDGHRPPDHKALTSQLLGVVRQVVQAQGAAFLKRQEKGWKAVAASPGVPFTTSASVPMKEGLVGLAGEADREILADPVHALSLGYLATDSQVSVALVPIHDRGTPSGILACHRAAGHPFGEGEAALLRRCAHLIHGWESLSAHIGRLESARLQEERVAQGLKKMLKEGDPEEIAAGLLDTLFDILPANYGYVVISQPVMQYYSILCKKFSVPDSFRLEKGTWTQWILANPERPLHLDGAPSRQTTMPILFGGEPFPEDKHAFLHPLSSRGVPFGVVGVVGRGTHPFEKEGLDHAAALVGPAAALFDLALLTIAQRNLAIRDPLTGLFNRRYLDESLIVELKRAQRQEASCGFILMDLDHFKEVNDRHGHEAGDIVLRTVAQRMRDSVREIDIVCRYGGEEFAVILPACDLSEAGRVAERVRADLEAAPVPVQEGLSLNITASLGASAFPGPAASLAALMKGVDAALYEAKKRGRNRVAIAGR